MNNKYKPLRVRREQKHLASAAAVKAELMKICDVMFPVLDMSQFHVGSVPGLDVKTWRTSPVCQSEINTDLRAHLLPTDVPKLNSDAVKNTDRQTDGLQQETTEQKYQLCLKLFLNVEVIVSGVLVCTNTER